LPLVVSLAALAYVLVSILMFGVMHKADEGASTHIWQLRMARLLLILAYFLIRWLPRAPKHCL
jgi:hypothetical protein